MDRRMTIIAVIALLGAHAPLAVAEISMSAGSCFAACFRCETRCDRFGPEALDCRQGCWDASAMCCESSGKKPIFMMCGCHERQP